MELKNMLQVINNENSRVNMFLVKKHNGGYITVNPSIKKNIEVDLKKIIETEIGDKLNCNKKPYNIIGVDDNVIETDNTERYTQISILKESLANPDEKEKIQARDFDFFLYKVVDEDKNNIFVLRRIKKMKFLKKGIAGNIVNGEFKKMTDADGVLAIDDKVDLLFDEDNLYIFQHISMERIFDLKNNFRENAIKVLERKKLRDKIVNFDNLKESALKNLNYIKRLAKLENTDSLLFLDDLGETKKVIDEFNLDIYVDLDKKKIRFDNPSQISAFISLMQDAYYRTLIGNHKGVDERR